MNLSFVLKKPISSEKAQKNAALGRFTFEVSQKAGKKEIKEAVENQFGVKVERVWTQRLAAKPKRSWGRREIFHRSPKKKAVILLEKGQKIDLFEIAEEEKKTRPSPKATEGEGEKKKKETRLRDKASAGKKEEK